MTKPNQALTIGVFTPFIGGFYLGEVTSALLAAAREHGARLLVVRTGDFNGGDILYADEQVAGWVILVRALSPESMALLAKRGKPVCCFGMDPGIEGILPVLSDNFSGIQTAMASLYASGRRHFAFVGNLQEFDMAQRRDAYLDFLAQHKLPQRPDWVIDSCSYETSGGYETMDTLLKMGIEMPDAFVCGNDQNADGVMSRLQEAGIRIPEDVAIVGYDDSALARTCKPPLASVNQNYRGLADEAVRHILPTEQTLPGVLSPRLVPSWFVPRRSACTEVSEAAEAEREITISEFLSSLSMSEEVLKFMLANPTGRMHKILPRIDPEMRWCLVSHRDSQTHMLHPQHVYSPACAVNTDRLLVDEAHFPPLDAFEEQGEYAGSMVSVMPVVCSGIVSSVIAVEVGPGLLLGPQRPLVSAHLLELLAFGMERSLSLETLETRVEQRTQELHHVNTKLTSTLSALRSAQAELVRNEKLAALGSLVVGIAHGLNTPLGNSLMLSSAMEDDLATLERGFVSGELTKKALADFIARANEAAAQLNRSIGTAASLVADFKRLATEQHTEKRQDFGLQELLMTCCQKLRGEHPGLTLTVTAFNDVTMTSYPFALSECIQQLGENAVQHGFVGRRGGRIDISVAYPTEGWVEIAVADNGIGIAPENLGRVFDPFYTTRLGAQHGLGLCTVFNLVTGILKGQIVAESPAGSGARFVLRIPRLATEDDAP